MGTCKHLRGERKKRERRENLDPTKTKTVERGEKRTGGDNQAAPVPRTGSQK